MKWTNQTVALSSWVIYSEGTGKARIKTHINISQLNTKLNVEFWVLWVLFLKFKKCVQMTWGLFPPTTFIISHFLAWHIRKLKLIIVGIWTSYSQLISSSTKLCISALVSPSQHSRLSLMQRQCLHKLKTSNVLYWLSGPWTPGFFLTPPTVSLVSS